ncbi:Serine protease S53 [Mycena venus]|uniref:Serine protease S53 n=1 Tax=Mycena venus TaxID=2733690 RepID=A0A8H6YKQ6_9AGAR|nr:Serine protease S53 [Mycena venus]
MLKHLTRALVFAPFAGVHSKFVILGRRDNAPPGFSLIGSPPADEVLTLRLALAQSNIQGLQDAVYDISTPGGPRYGQYLTQAEVDDYVVPSAETLDRVNTWLAASNLMASPLTSAGDWVKVNMTVAQANTLLAADFSTFQIAATNQTVIRTLSYSIPSALQNSIHWIHPTISFPDSNSLAAPPRINNISSVTSAHPPTVYLSADCQGLSNWNPACLQELYEIPSTPAKPAANVFGVSGFQNDFSNKRDLRVYILTFLEIYRPDINPNTTFNFLSVDQGINNQLPGGAGQDGNSNIQYAIALATGVPVTFISTGTLPNDLITEMLDQANYLLSLEQPPQTLLNTALVGVESFVFGGGGFSQQMAISLCNAYAQLAARGVSLIVQTDIFGAGGIPALPSCMPFDPPFPATCPFVTAVGGTEFDANQNELEETPSKSSGGGFSSHFARPRYQDTAVSAYLAATNNTNSTAFNVSGRAVPDLSAISMVDFIFEQRVFNLSHTPQFSAAIFASVVALLTNERIAAGKPGLGFLNPLIYQHGNAFKDFTTGSNPGCNSPGFNATSGWDPVSGFGSPSYSKLQKIIQDL